MFIKYKISRKTFRNVCMILHNTIRVNEMLIKFIEDYVVVYKQMI